MTPGRWRKIEELYSAANHCSPGERTALLERSDPDVRAVVERMLAQASDNQILDSPPFDFLDRSAETLVMGSQFGPYEIEALIGAGGMGTVYRALDTRLGREVAVKVAAAHYSERFQREAQAISTLNHPNICTLHDIGPNYLVMELIDGSTLAEEIRKGPLPPALVARYGAQIAAALAEAHAHDIVHRDLKPANIMITRHGVKVLDFGLAKMLSKSGITDTHAIMGTPAYMAPEQVEGRTPTSSTDLFALGLVLYEMAVGKAPFPGASLGQMLSSGTQPAIRAPSKERAGLPASLDTLVAKLLKKDHAERPPSAASVAQELSALADRLSGRPAPSLRSLLRSVYAILAMLSVLLLVAGAAWFYYRSEQRHWAREQAIPEISKLSSNQPLAAFMLLSKAEKILPGDAQLAQLDQSLTRLTSVESAPSGAKVEIQDYLSPDSPWFPLGSTPLKNVKMPKGYFRWRVSKPGAGEFISAPPAGSAMKFTLDPQVEKTGMVPVPGGMWADMIDFVGWLQYEIPAFDIDRFEVTNAQYQQFVDQGGYRKPEYWKEKFIQDGKELTWQQAMDLFRDPTGRPGPSTWEGGGFPPGRADFPVSGVSWYEAQAYAAFAGKSLPVFLQFDKASPPDLARYAINQSNFDGRGPARAGSLKGVGRYGTYDMSGNVREWSSSALEDGRRFILGGAWRTQTYQAYDPEALPPLDRSEMNGFRCVLNHGALSPRALAPVTSLARDFSKAKPASDEAFQLYKDMYAYTKTPVNASNEGPLEDMPNWTRQRITIDAGYEKERLPLYLFLPKNVQPPLQAVVFYPSARVNDMPSSKSPGDMAFVDYVIKSGRAVVYPIYVGTYERKGQRLSPGCLGDLERIIKNSKEVDRSVDYLETRTDFDKSKIAYLGVSQGAAEGVIFAAMEPRFKTAVFLDGGFFLGSCYAARDQVNFVTRVKIPVLMVNGRYDFTFSPDRSQNPMFRMLGTPEADKRHVIFDTPHDISQQKADLSKEVLAWLDKYLGRVN